MKYYISTTEFNCGIDLHSRQMYVCAMDRAGNKLVHTNIQGNDFGEWALHLSAKQGLASQHGLTRVQPRLGAKPDGTSAEVGERRGVLDDRQEQPLLPFAL